MLQEYMVHGLQLHANNSENLYFMQDKEAAHFTNITYFLNKTFPSIVHPMKGSHLVVTTISRSDTLISSYKVHEEVYKCEINYKNTPSN
jgi:hypothetical protein